MLVDPISALANVASITLTLPLPTLTHSHSHTHSSHTHSSTTTSATMSSTPIPTGMPIYQEAGPAGERTLWIVFVIMLVATMAFSAMSWTVPVSKRLYHVVTTIIVMTAALSYFAMATGEGVSLHRIVEVESHKHVPDTSQIVYREVYWARYVDWSLTTPLLLLDLCLLAGLDGAHIFMAIVADLVMILTGLFAAFGAEDTPQKWGWYTISCTAYLVVIWHLAIHGRAQAMGKGGKVAGFFASIASFTLILWTAYPIVWGIADGSRRVSVSGEIICYAILDVMAKPIFGLWLLVTHMNMPETHADLGGFWAHGLTSEGSIRVGDDDEGA